MNSHRHSFQYDLIIKNGRLVDGTGNPTYSGDVGLRDGKIVEVGVLSHGRAARSVDVEGRVVAPGFIDMLGQSELTIMANPHLPSKIFQGITTEFTGEGGSPAPINDALIEVDHRAYEKLGISPDWRDFDQYFARLERQGIGINIGCYVGATQIRRIVLGDSDRTPNPSELTLMRELVSEAMRAGAVGLSSALQYAPGIYATTHELLALATEAAQFGGSYATHLRSESNAILSALSEAFKIARHAETSVEIWHLKAAGRQNWGRMPEIVSWIDQARKEGLDITADVYPYTAWFNSFSSFTPPWAREGGAMKLVERLKDESTRGRIRVEIETADNWENQWKLLEDPEAIVFAVSSEPELRKLQGKTIAEIAAISSKDPLETIFDLLIADPAAFTASFGMCESDMIFALQQRWVSVCTDSQGTAPDGILGDDHPHPRAYGSFPRVLTKYVRDNQVLSLEEAIRKFTSLPARRMRLRDRGILKEGMWADIVVFDPAFVKDRATYERPNQLASGMEYVFVNGEPVIFRGELTNALPGKVLKGPGFTP